MMFVHLLAGVVQVVLADVDLHDGEARIEPGGAAFVHAQTQVQEARVLPERAHSHQGQKNDKQVHGDTEQARGNPFVWIMRNNRTNTRNKYEYEVEVQKL